MKYQQWINQIPIEIKEDAVWSLKAYQAALFAADLCWLDTKPIINKKMFSLSDQLYRSVGSISANIAEGYSRHSLKEQARFYEIALGSTREGKDWYFKSRHILGEEIAIHRLKLLTSIAKLLLTMINERRNAYHAKDEKVIYDAVPLDELLLNAPISKVN